MASAIVYFQILVSDNYYLFSFAFVCVSSYEFFNDLYHRFLLTNKINMKCMCLHALAIVYGKCYEDIGAFNDTRYIVQMLDRVRESYFLHTLRLVKMNEI